MTNIVHKNPGKLESFWLADIQFSEFSAREENLSATKEMIMGHVESGKIENIEMLNPGEGGTIKKGINHFAVYRDEDGLISLCSAVCTHLGCIVQWNSAEKTFDCPCHGSRFNAKGEVMTGPAIRNLKKVEIEVGTIS